MTYELLKRLRDSGFPLKPISVEFGKQISLDRPAVVFSRSNGNGKAEARLYYIPSLSDLVEACGEKLESMARVSDGWECNTGQNGSSTHGPTLQDALAALWLNHRPAAAVRSRRPSPQPALQPDRDFTVEG